MQRVNPPRRQGQVDRPAAHEPLRAGVGTSLVDRDVVARLGEQTREQAARQPGADDGDSGCLLSHHRTELKHGGPRRTTEKETGLENSTNDSVLESKYVEVDQEPHRLS